MTTFTASSRFSCLSNYEAITSTQLATTSTYLNVHPSVQKTFALLCEHIDMHPENDTFLSCTIKRTTLARKRKLSLRQIDRHIETLTTKGVISTFANSLPTNFGLPKRTANSYVVEVIKLDDLIGKHQQQVAQRIKENLLKIKAKTESSMAVIRERIKRKLNGETSLETKDADQQSSNKSLVSTVINYANGIISSGKNISRPSRPLATPQKFTDCHNRYLALELYESEQDAWEQQAKSAHWYDPELQIMYRDKTKAIAVGVMKNTSNHEAIICQYVDEMLTYITQEHKDAVYILNNMIAYANTLKNVISK